MEQYQGYRDCASDWAKTENGPGTYLGVSEEAIVQFPRPSYSRVNFEGGPFFAGYGLESGTRIVLFGI
jgi:hypothetical protein